MAFLVLLMLTAALTNAAVRVEAWGQDGHAIIREVAEMRRQHFSTKRLWTQLRTCYPMQQTETCPLNARGPITFATQQNTTGVPHCTSLTHQTKLATTTAKVCIGDCVSSDVTADFCSAGALKNYTSQLTGTASGKYKLTEAVLFLIHFVGDIHQPVHCGFIGDVGGNTISVNWYSTSTNLHHVWDTSIITTTYDDYFNSQAGDLAASIVSNITTSQVKEWSACPSGTPPCVDTYAKESVALACSEAYADAGKGHVSNGETLSDAYFSSRYPVVEQRLAMGGVRLAAILNTIFAYRKFGFGTEPVTRS